MNARDRRALAVGAAAVAVAAGLRLLPSAAAEVGRRQEAVEQKQTMLSRVREEIGGVRALTDSAPALERRLIGLAPLLLEGRNARAAEQHVTRLLGAQLRRHEVRLTRDTAFADSARAGRLRRITRRLALEGDTRGTLALLGRLEREEPALILNEVTIRAADPRAGPEIPESLRSEIIISGWFMDSVSSSRP